MGRIVILGEKVIGSPGRLLDGGLHRPGNGLCLPGRAAYRHGRPDCRSRLLPGGRGLPARRLLGRAGLGIGRGGGGLGAGRRCLGTRRTLGCGTL